MEKKEIITTSKQHPYAVIKVSDKGKDIIEHLKEQRKEALNQLLQGLSLEEKDQICNYLVKLITNMEGGNA